MAGELIWFGLKVKLQGEGERCWMVFMIYIAEEGDEKRKIWPMHANIFCREQALTIIELARKELGEAGEKGIEMMKMAAEKLPRRIDLPDAESAWSDCLDALISFFPRVKQRINFCLYEKIGGRFSPDDPPPTNCAKASGKPN